MNGLVFKGSVLNLNYSVSFVRRQQMDCAERYLPAPRINVIANQVIRSVRLEAGSVSFGTTPLVQRLRRPPALLPYCKSCGYFEIVKSKGVVRYRTSPRLYT